MAEKLVCQQVVLRDMRMGQEWDFLWDDWKEWWWDWRKVV
jgi:hypothetical protein